MSSEDIVLNWALISRKLCAYQTPHRFAKNFADFVVLVQVDPALFDYRGRDHEVAMSKTLDEHTTSCG